MDQVILSKDKTWSKNFKYELKQSRISSSDASP